MIATLLRIGWLNLTRDRVAQALTFLLPIVFFSIFAAVFSNQGDTTRRIPVAVVDLDQTAYSRALVAALSAEGGLRVRTSRDEAGGPPLDRTIAEALVRDGDVPVAVVLPKGIGAAPVFFGPPAQDAPKVQILADVSDPVAPQVVAGLLQKATFTAAPDRLARAGVGLFEKYAGPLTEAQRRSFEEWQSGSTSATASAPMGMPTEIVDVMQSERESRGIISFYAAGIGVMFLLFSCAGGGGSLLEEQESGTLDRLLGSRAGMTGVLLGKWLFLALTGVAQLTVMFTWGAIVFGLPLTAHLPGFFVMTAVTAAAAAAFGLVLATASRSRAQLSGISTIVILAMSAMGGSMFPRFLMSETMQQAGLVTFNAWALDGYLKVFWRGAPILDLWPQVAVLGALTGTFLALARVLARRWEGDGAGPAAL